jgi:hypothetical protein
MGPRSECRRQFRRIWTVVPKKIACTRVRPIVAVQCAIELLLRAKCAVPLMLLRRYRPVPPLPNQEALSYQFFSPRPPCIITITKHTKHQRICGHATTVVVPTTNCSWLYAVLSTILSLSSEAACVPGLDVFVDADDLHHLHFPSPVAAAATRSLPLGFILPSSPVRRKSWYLAHCQAVIGSISAHCC